MNGKFITVEGGEGAGKSTNIDYIRNYLEEAGVSVVITREPGGTHLGEEIRDILIKPRDGHSGEGFVDPMAELLLIFAARAQHIAEVIRPALESGQWVISDRFTDATYAYQGAGRELGTKNVAILENLVQEELRPDRTIILDLPIASGMSRVHDRADPDRFEREHLDFFERVRAWYIGLPEIDPERYQIIDASRSLPEVQTSLSSLLDGLLDLRI